MREGNGVENGIGLVQGFIGFGMGDGIVHHPGTGLDGGRTAVHEGGANDNAGIHGAVAAQVPHRAAVGATALVFGLPDELPQEKKGLGDYLGVIDYATKTDWSARVPGEDAVQWYDVARRLAPDADGPYTWWTYRGQAFNNDAGWRIDYQAATKSNHSRIRM